MKKWLIIETRSRWEKKVLESLEDRGVECYCPLNLVPRHWSDRIKMIQEPLFKKLIFVRIDEGERSAVRRLPGVINFLYRDGKLCAMKDKELLALRAFLDQHRQVHLQVKERRGRECLFLLPADADNASRKSLVIDIDHLPQFVNSNQVTYTLS